MQAAVPTIKDLVFIGGGHTHAITLRKLGMADLKGVQLTLITNLVDTPYSGMLPCHISGLYGFDESHIDLRPLTRFARCRLVMDRAIALDLEQQRVICAQHPPVAYDVLSIDTGSTPATVSVPGAAEYSIPAKPVPDLLRQWNAILEALRTNPDVPLTLGIVGGGVGGVELILNIQERFKRLLEELGRSPNVVTLHLFHRGERLAPGRNRRTQRRLETLLKQRGVKLHLQESVTGIKSEGFRRQVSCASGLSVTCDHVIWVTHASAPAWPRQAGLSTDEQGFITVRDTLQTCSHDNVFAVGDVATMVNHPRPKAGVFAVRQGPPLFKNLLRFLQGKPLRPFIPQRQFLNIIDIGYGQAIASRGPFMFESHLARRWKHHIDQRFMALFRDFPPMTEKRGSGGAKGIERRGEAGAGGRGEAGMEDAGKIGEMLPSAFCLPPSAFPPLPCAGCGSKVGRSVLEQALQRVTAELPVPQREDILVGLQAPDDAAVVRVPADMAMLHTVDHFRALLDDPFIFAQVALQHCLSDLYAMGAVPQSVLALATVPYALPAKQVEALYHLLCGIQKVLAQTATPLVGGHTTEGPELALGFACNGLARPEELLHKGGMAPGDVLILTKPLGTGTLFAADMQFQAKGRWIEAAVDHMLQSNQAAGDCFRAHGATACTDVTGFGLMGHLLEMVQASQVAVELTLADLPLLEGVRSTLSASIFSSLQAQNAQAAAALENASSYRQKLEFPVLFDPQTSGGLLASVPENRVEACLSQLHELGYRASVPIGQVKPSENRPQPIRIKQW